MTQATFEGPGVDDNMLRMGHYFLYCIAKIDKEKQEVVLAISTIKLIVIALEIEDSDGCSFEEAYKESFLLLIDNINEEFIINHIEYRYERSKQIRKTVILN